MSPSNSILVRGKKYKKRKKENEILKAENSVFARERSALYDALNEAFHSLGGEKRKSVSWEDKARFIKNHSEKINQLKEKVEEVEEELEHQLFLENGADNRWKKEIDAEDRQKREKDNQNLQLLVQIREQKTEIQRLENGLFIVNQIAEAEINERERERERDDFERELTIFEENWKQEQLTSQKKQGALQGFSSEPKVEGKI